MRHMDEHQEQFLRDELFSLTLMATVQRAHVYVPNADDKARSNFQKGLRSSLERLQIAYCGPVSEEDHIRNITALSEKLSRDYGDVLSGRRFRIGTAQKALNLYLKYLWCIGKVPIPPHCPFDYRVIAKLPQCRGINWTALDDPAQYQALVTAAKAKAGNMPLAVWELRTYNGAF